MLVVEDDEMLRDTLVRTSKALAEVRGAANGVQARAMARHLRFDVALVDLGLGPESGFAVVSWLRRRQPWLGITLITAAALTAELALDAAHAGADDVMGKPFRLFELVAQLETRRAARTEVADRRSLAQAEWDHIQRVLADCGDNKTQATRVLGISRSTLLEKLRAGAPED